MPALYNFVISNILFYPIYINYNLNLILNQNQWIDELCFNLLLH